MQQLAECRVSERHNCQVPASCQPAAANEMRWAGVIENISQTGVRLRLKRRFEPRTGVAIELPGKSGLDPETVYAKVVHVANDGGGSYVLGCTFMSALSDEELQRLLTAHGSDSYSTPQLADSAIDDSAPQAPATNDVPQATVVSGVRLWIGVGEGEVIRCRVKRFHAPGPLPLLAGKALNLRGVSRNGSRLEHPVEVVHCSPDGDGWLLQVRATNAPNDVREAFGR
jgi:PilZ domain